MFSCAFNLENLDSFTSYYVENVNTIHKLKALLVFGLLLNVIGLVFPFYSRKTSVK